MRLVLDTDVIVSALRSPKGASAALLRLARQGAVTLLANIPMVLEYEAVCQRDEHRETAGLTRDEVNQFLDAVVALIEPVETYYFWRPQLRDADDEMVLEAAINGGAGLIVSFNIRDYGRATERFGIEVVRPADALRRILQ
jgi:putative PIN family toxin of toxin-antitoxin system